jgi:phosphoglycolate phosphatase
MTMVPGAQQRHGFAVIVLAGSFGHPGRATPIAPDARQAERCCRMNNRELLVCDLDNTLYDSVGCFVPSFYAAVDAIVAITGCDREELLDDFREVHQKQGDLEQPFSLLELDIIKRSFRGESSESIVAALDLALNAFDSARKNYLRLHRDVSETLDLLNVHGVKLVAHTESKLFGVVERLTRLDLFRFFPRCIAMSARYRFIQHRGKEQGGWSACR